MEKSREFLQQILEGTSPTVSDIDQLINESVMEGLYLDYKHGELLKDKEKAKNTIRQYMSGFAHSDGGVLIIGIEESEEIPIKVTGCNPGHVGRQSLDVWANSCISGIAGQFTSRPTFHVVEHPDGKVLVCAVARSYYFVQLPQQNNPYFIRVGDQTFSPPEYLISDLVLGRRQQPILEVTDWNLYRFEQPIPHHGFPLMSMRFDLTLQIENTGLAWGEECHWGMITKTESGVSATYRRYPLGSHLLGLVETRSDLDEMIDAQGEIFHFGGKIGIDSPMSSEGVMIPCQIPLSYLTQVLGYSWMAGIYIISKNGMPNWFQLALRVDDNSRPLFNQVNGLPRTPEVFTVERVHGIRPKAGWIKGD